MPDKAATHRAWQSLESAKVELAGLLPAFLAAIDRSSGIQDELGVHMKSSAYLYDHLASSLAMLPGAIAAFPASASLQSRLDDLLAWQVHLEPLLKNVQQDVDTLWQDQAKMLDCQRRVHAGLDMAEDPVKLGESLAEINASLGDVLERVGYLTRLVDRLQSVNSEYDFVLADVHINLLAEPGDSTLLGLLNDIKLQNERLVKANLELAAMLPRISTACREIQQQVEFLASGLVRVENERMNLESLTRLPKRGITDLSTAFPVVLFPVRLETRFNGSTLKVRIYPDTIVIDTHDERLTQAELEAGQAYWQQLFEIPLPGNTPHHHGHMRERIVKGARQAEEAAWRGLLSHYSAARAAWILQATRPGNLEARGVDKPAFPPVKVRDQQWSQGAQVNILPDHWVLLAYRDGQMVHRVESTPLKQPLQVSPRYSSSPGGSASARVGSQGARDAAAWMFDFQKALDAGMGVEVHLRQEDLERGFERLIVYGVKASLQAGEGQQCLEELLAGHHYSQGLAFVARGTPTNNTSAGAAGYPALDVDGRESFAIEQADRSLELDSEALRLARALGVKHHILERVAGAERTPDRCAEAMNSALWTVTLGYYLNRMISPVFERYRQRYGTPTNPEVAIEDVRKHFLEYVRGGGPLPAIRVGWTPYGVLPISSLRRWKSPAGTTDLAEGYMATVLRSLQPAWLRQVEQLPRIGRNPGDPDRDLLEVLGMDASAREVRLRRVLGREFISSLARSAGLAQGELVRRILEISDRITAVGDPALWDPDILSFVFSEDAFRFRNDLVAPEPLSEDEGFADDRNYIAGIRQATMLELKSFAFRGAKPPQSLLLFMLRHAALREYALEAWYKLGFREVSDNMLSDAERDRLYREARKLQKDLLLWDREFHGIRKYDEDWKTVWDILDEAIQFEPNLNINSFNDALEVLESQPTAELERLFTETLDVCSHRLDAWITSLASRRLEEMRVQNNQGCHLGAFGWVEHLHPDPESSYGLVALPDGRTVRGQIDRGGYIQAPSMDHAAAAAVLRNAYMTAGGANQGRYAVNLSSRRVRIGLELLDGLRQGQPLAALLGYRLERSLHERKLDRYIEPLRKLFPLVASKPLLDRMENGGEPSSAIAARNVVDGLALRKTWRDGSLRLPSTLNPAQITPDLELLDQAVDAVADLLLSESVFQGVRGNMTAAAASLDSLSRGVRPPDPEVVHQPRGGIPLTHRVAVVLGSKPMPAVQWQAIPVSPRAIAEPYVDAWAGQLLGDPKRVFCRVYRVDKETGEKDISTEKKVSLFDLGLRPMDILALAQGLHTQAAASELDERIAGLFFSGEEEPVPLAIEYTRAEGWDCHEVVTFPEILELANALNTVLGSARPLRATDLAKPESVSIIGAAGDDANVDEEDAARRAGEVAGLLRHAIEELAAAPHAEMHAKLRKTSLFGLASALTPVPYNELPEKVKAVQAVLMERLRHAEKSGSSPLEVLEALFDQPVVFLPRFWPGDAEKIYTALKLGTDMVAKKPDAAEKWLQQTARIRPVLRQWRRLDLYTQALAGQESGIQAMAFEVAQLPPRAYDSWAALPFKEDAAPPGGLVSLVLHRPAHTLPEAPWVGLLIDEWVELIPNPNEVTGLAFHYDSPGAEAPQAVLVAVPPDDAPHWSEDALVESLLETMDLARIRMVDLDLLGELGQLLPATFLAANAAGDTVETDFSNLVIGDPPVA